jgi:hypothetical protein
LIDEGFNIWLRFSGCCNYFSVGGCFSGRLSLLRLRYKKKKVFDRFWKRCQTISTAEEAERLFREAFPEFRGNAPFNRNSTGFEGEPDDAQIMDESLFQQLKDGFSTSVDYSYEIKEPNVIFTDSTDESEWPKTGEEAEKYWVVVIDYH